MHNNEKTITLPMKGAETTFRLRKMDAFTGATLLKFITEKLMPFLTPVLEKANTGNFSAALEKLLPRFLRDLGDYEMTTLMQRCLSHVDILLPAGPHPVYDNNTFGLPELETNTVLCIRLTFEEILFCLQGFFDESGLTLPPPAQNTQPPAAST